MTTKKPDSSKSTPISVAKPIIPVKPVFQKPSFGGSFDKGKKFPMPIQHHGVR